MNMDLNIHLDKNIKIENHVLQKMILLYNALEEGWGVKKQNDSYVFTKKHENKKEVVHEDFLYRFMKTNLDYEKVFTQNS
jgi:hypothetical protein